MRRKINEISQSQTRQSSIRTKLTQNHTSIEQRKPQTESAQFEQVNSTIYVVEPGTTQRSPRTPSDIRQRVGGEPRNSNRKHTSVGFN